MKKLRFLHIPKTAGSTFTRILRSQYKGKARFVFSGDNPKDRERFSKLSKDEQKAIVLFTGHAPIVSGVKDADEIPIIAILRDPVSRVKSFCQYVSEGKVKYVLNSYPPEKFNLDEFLLSGNSELCNLQSRMLINYEEGRSGLVIGTLTPEKIQQKALDNLFNKVACYGLQEYFDETIVQFARQFGWRTPYYEYINRKNLRRLLTFEDRHIDKIEELNAIDIGFYRMAKERFVSAMESDKEFVKMCQKFKRAQKIASPMMRVYGNAGRYLKKQYRALGDYRSRV